MKHGLPLEFPANSSPEIVGTRPMREYDVPHPSSFSKKEREGRMIKTDKTLIDLVHTRLGGSTVKS
jgi:hypothetical protein